MKKVFKKIHIWLSAPVGILVSLVCFTGAILVFETEITELCNSSRYFVKEVKDKPLTLNELIPIVNNQLPNTTSIASIQIPSEPERTYRVGLSGKSRAAAYVDPYTGEIIEQHNSQKSFFSQTRQLHRWLLFQGESRTTGKMIVGITTIIFVIILITGLIAWIPKNRGQLKKRLRIRLRSGRRKFWYDLHLAGGTYSLIILLVLSLTGLTWSFEWYRNAFYGMFGVEFPKNAGGRHQQRSAREEKTIDFSKWQDVVIKIQGSEANYKAITIQDGSATASTNSSYGNSRALDRYTFDAETSDIKEFKPYAEQEKVGKLRGWIYSIHVGSWGGFSSKLITFIAAFFGGILPLSGYYLYIKRNFKKKRAKKKI